MALPDVSDILLEKEFWTTRQPRIFFLQWGEIVIGLNKRIYELRVQAAAEGSQII